MNSIRSRTAPPWANKETSHARCCVRLVAVTPQRAWAPPIGYGDGPPSLRALEPPENLWVNCITLDTDPAGVRA
jgi:hypothetical protein